MTDDFSVPELMPPSIFAAMEGLCREALAYGGNHPDVRAKVVGMVFALREQAHSTIGFDTPEIVSLVHLLKRTDRNYNASRVPRTHPLQELERERKLTPFQLSAAQSISDVWAAFGRYLMIAGKGFGGGGGGGGEGQRAKSPIDQMSEELWTQYRTQYVPWQWGSKKRGHLNVILQIVVEGVHPYEIDRMLGLRTGKALKLLRSELDYYTEPQAAADAKEGGE